MALQTLTDEMQRVVRLGPAKARLTIERRGEGALIGPVAL